jgi:hypothetical protein
VNNAQDNLIPADLVDVVERLHQDKPELGALDLDRVKVRAIRQAARSATAPRQKGLIMKSRFAVTTMLVFGIFMTGTGATLATSKDAADHVYVKTTTTTPTDSTVRTETTPATTAPAAPAAGTVPQTLAQPDQSPVVAGEVESDDVAPKAEPRGDVQPARQAAADEGDKLPFTGFAAIPILLGGLGLIGGGLALRRGADRE